MKAITLMLREEVYKLEEIVQKACERLENSPEGFLRVSKKKGSIEYYHKGETVCKGNGKYIKKNEMELVRRIAQRDYDAKIVKAGKERIKAINTFLKKYEKTSLKEIYNKTNRYRRELIQASVISDEEYIKRWQAVKYAGKAFSDDAPEIITERGERVRSKSEKIIADKLYTLGIPYRYEYPLILEGKIKVYPDFTILRMPERKEVYLEHFGKMDNSEYIDGMVYKLNTYQRNGIYLGVNLFMTHETGKNPLNTKALDKMLKLLFESND